VLIPTLSQEGFGILFGGVGLAGLIYSSRNCIAIVKRAKVERVDHAWYGFLPVLAYLTLCSAVVLALAGLSGWIETMSGALALLLIGGVRNAWDLILYFVREQSAR